MFHLYMFQSTHPRGVRHTIIHFIGLVLSFNPRTHEGCDFILLSLHCVSRVSIHAPTRGATSLKCDATTLQLLFQSTHPRGVRRPLVTALLLVDKVSIHAPTRGATERKILLLMQIMFQSTHPRGVRPIV